MSMTTGTRYTLVPDTIDALVAMFGAAAVDAAAGLPLDANGNAQTVEVIDGGPTSDLPANYVMVGYNAGFASQGFSGTTGLAVDGSRTLSETGNRQFGEAFSVWCEASTFTGDSDPGALSRQRIATGILVSALWASIEADPTLQGVVTNVPAYAVVSSFQWLLDRPGDGVGVTVRFAVSIVGELWVPR